MAGLGSPAPLPFAKMSGSGNDFILVDNRRGVVSGLDLPALARRVCHRHLSVGADGLILIEESRTADFRWQFFNADGSRAEMCGNGGRCAARFAHQAGIAPARMRFETAAGVIEAEVRGSTVRIGLTRPTDWREEVTVEAQGAQYRLAFVNTGVPHAVLFLEDAEAADVARVGRAIRFHPFFAPAGTNVNFVSADGAGRLRVRTYERGVEGETQACGTGSVASALAAWKKGRGGARTEVLTTGGEVLVVHIEPQEGEELPSVSLEGGTILVCRGEICPEGYAG